MNYYAELGVHEEASRDEIRSAYLRLAKAVHPDHIHDANRRASAEPRMIRLNQIMEVLGNEERRREYDYELARERAAKEARVQQALAMQDRELSRRHASPELARGIVNSLWIGVGAVAAFGVAAMLWMPEATSVRFTNLPSAAAEEARPAPAKSPVNRVATPSIPVGQPTIAAVQMAPQTHVPSTVSRQEAPPQESALVAEARRALATPVREMEAPRIPVVAQQPPPPQAQAPAPVAAAHVATVAPPPPPPAVKPAVVAVAEPKPAAPRWVGSWRLNGASGPGPGSALSGDMVLVETGGRIQGAYRGRYSSGAAETADVDLQLTPMSYGPEWMRGVWSGNGGAYGQFELKRGGNGIVQMNWWTTKLGETTKLASGAVKLSERSN